MWEDPIVAEVHRIREELAAKFNYDVKAFFADMRKRQVEFGARLVSPKSRSEPASAVDPGPQPPAASSCDSTAALPGT